MILKMLSNLLSDFAHFAAAVGGGQNLDGVACVTKEKERPSLKNRDWGTRGTENRK